MAGYLGFDATDTKPYIFISYNTEDQVRLSKIAQALRDHQVNIWYDNGIHRISDEEWQEQIAIHIREAEIVFFFLTQGIFEKKNSFVKKEYDLATRHAKKVCLVMLDKIDPEIIPAKYDFWWGEIKSRQCIEAADMSDVKIAEEIYKECCGAGIVKADGRQWSDNSASASQQNGSHASAAPQQGGKKPMSAALIAVPVILIAVIGLFAFRALSGGSNKKPESATAANTVVEAESNEPAAAGVTADAAKAEAGTTAVTGSSANSQDVQTSSADAAAAGAAQQDEASAELQDEAGADAVLPESEAEEEVQEDPYKDVILPKSLPDEFYVEKDHTYAFYDASRYGFTTYKEVVDFCRQQGGHLAVINNAAENNYLFRLLRDVSEITAFSATGIFPTTAKNGAAMKITPNSIMSAASRESPATEPGMTRPLWRILPTLSANGNLMSKKLRRHVPPSDHQRALHSGSALFFRFNNLPHVNRVKYTCEVSCSCALVSPQKAG